MTANIKEIPYIFRTTFGAPLDVRYIISSLDKLLEELPIALRYEGMMIYIQNLHEPYIFKNGTNDSNCVPLVQTTGTQAVAKLMTAGPGPVGMAVDRIYIDSDDFVYINDVFKSNKCEIELLDEVTGEKLDVVYKYDLCDDLSHYELHILSNLRGFYEIHMIPSR